MEIAVQISRIRYTDVPVNISKAQKDYCGWQENKNFEPPAYIDEDSGEAICLCGDLAPLSNSKTYMVIVTG